MQPKWNRMGCQIAGSKDSNPGTLNTYFDYDLGRWLFGFDVGFDPAWIEFSFSSGPLSVTLIYWR